MRRVGGIGSGSGGFGALGLQKLPAKHLGFVVWSFDLSNCVELHEIFAAEVAENCGFYFM